MAVASRYAKSLIDLALETKHLDEVMKDMRLVNKVCAENSDFVNMLKSPVIKTDKKQEIFKALFEGKVSKTTLGFLKLIAAKTREAYIPEIANEVEEQYKIRNNITTAKVTTAIGLDEKLRNQILDIVKQNASGEIELIEKVDPSLIGGFVLNIDDKQVDQSVKRKLNDLRKNFSGAVYLN